MTVKLSAERLDKARTAVSAAAKQLTRHPECEMNPSEINVEVHSNQHFTVVAADLLFNKTGKAIFENPHKYDSDYDHPVLVGEDTLADAMRDAAKTARIRMTPNVKTYISPSEKGWVEVGLQFIHKTG